RPRSLASLGMTNSRASPLHGTIRAVVRVPKSHEATMLGDRQAVATIAVRDLNAAKRFYETSLGLKQIDSEGEEAAGYRTGTARRVVYRSQFAGTNQAPAVTWNVGNDLDAVIRELKSKGVTFEHFDMPMM